MLYKLLHLPSRLALYFYCRNISVNHPLQLRQQGPLLLAANHPNSFLDAIIIATLFKFPVYSLARGDAFAGKVISKILRSLNMLPVYRVSEGVENLEHNYSTFDEVQELFRQGNIVLIFSEGSCINEWHLRPLKKGTARLAITAWQNNIPLRVLPLGINYSSFRRSGKKVVVNFGEIVSKGDINEDLLSGKAMNEFNEKLRVQLKKLVYEIAPNDSKTLTEIFYPSRSSFSKILLWVPSKLGFIIHAPLYYAIHFIIKSRARDHYDSIMVGLLFLLYPVYMILIFLGLFFLTKSWYALFTFILLPVSALSLIKNKKLF